MGRRALTLRIEGRLSEVALLTAAVEAVSAELGLCPEDAEAVQLSVVEAVNNGIEHAGLALERRSVEVTMASDEGRLAIEVIDRGEPIPPGVLEAAARRARDPDNEDREDLMADRGRGLVIIHRMMSEVSYASLYGQNVLTMALRLRSSS